MLQFRVSRTWIAVLEVCHLACLLNAFVATEELLPIYSGTHALSRNAEVGLIAEDTKHRRVDPVSTACKNEEQAAIGLLQLHHVAVQRNTNTTLNTVSAIVMTDGDMVAPSVIHNATGVIIAQTEARFARHRKDRPKQLLQGSLQQELAPQHALSIVILVLLINGIAAACFLCCLKRLKPNTCSHVVWESGRILAVLIALILLCIAIDYMLGAGLVRVIERYDVAFIGVNLTVQELRLNPFTGRVAVHGVEIGNPPGWKSPYLFKADYIEVALEPLPFFISLGNNINLDRVYATGINVIYERSLKTSNVAAVMDDLMLEGDADRIVKLREVDISNVSARAEASGMFGIGLSTQVPDIYYGDFMAEVGGYMLDDVIRILLKAILDSSLNVVGKS